MLKLRRPRYANTIGANEHHSNSLSNSNVSFTVHILFGFYQISRDLTHQISVRLQSTLWLLAQQSRQLPSPRSRLKQIDGLVLPAPGRVLLQKLGWACLIWLA